jgi:ABC-type branched-subunit amino acid transport system substrate-binding protein
MVRTAIAAAVAALVLAAAGTGGAGAAPVGPKPFFDANRHRTDYAGPGRDDPAPADVREVRIGWFGPSDPADPRGGDLWRAATLAVDEANTAGGHEGRPLRLMPAWSENPWGSGVAQVTRLVYTDGVWAIVGGIDGPSTHLAEQVVAKARLPLVSPACSDKTATLANVPWIFSVAPADDLLASALAGEIARSCADGDLVVLSADDHDSRLLWKELRKCLGRRQIVPRYHLRFRKGAEYAEAVAGGVAAIAPAVVVLLADAADSARLLATLRERGFTGTVFGGPTMGRTAFLEGAGAAAEGVVFPLLWPPDPSPAFARTFKERFGREPDYAAAQAYDAVRLVVAAIARAGLNRARIRDALGAMGPWCGASGPVRWDGLGRNRRHVGLGTVEGGRITVFGPPPAPKTEPPSPP